MFNPKRDVHTGGKVFRSNYVFYLIFIRILCVHGDIFPRICIKIANSKKCCHEDNQNRQEISFLLNCLRCLSHVVPPSIKNFPSRMNRFSSANFLSQKYAEHPCLKRPYNYTLIFLFCQNMYTSESRINSAVVPTIFI